MSIRPAGQDGERYFLDCDSSGHYYVVPENRRQEWGAWINFSEDNGGEWTEEQYDYAWNIPTYAIPVNGSFSRITFALPEGF